MSGVLKRECTEVKERKVYGYCGDHIFEILRKTQNYYEIQTLEKWTPYIGKVETILDVGANLGNHTLYWEKRLEAKKIFSFEPYGPNYENLVLNIQANNLEKVVTPVMKAVGKHGGKVKLENVDQTNFGGTTFEYVDGEKDEYTEIISIDDFAQENEVKRIGLIKVDTEGFEIDVLQGAMNTLRRDRPIIWVEVSSETYKRVRRMLEELQYDFADVEAFNMLFIPNEKNKNNIHVSNEKILDAMFLYKTRVDLYFNNYEKTKRRCIEKDQKIDILSAESERLKEKLDITEQNYQKAQECYHTTQKKNEALIAENERLTKQLSTMEQNYQKTKERNQANTVKIDQLGKMVIAKQEEIERFHEQLDQYVNIAEQYVDDEYKETEMSEALIKQLNHNRLIGNEYAGLLAKFVDQSEKNEAFIRDMTQHVNKLQAKVNYLKNENKDYRAKLEKITSVWYGKLGIKVYKALKRAQASLKDMLKR